MAEEKLTLEQLTDLVSEASGHGTRFGAPIIFKRSVGDEGAFIAVSVEINGSNHSVSAGGADHRAALVSLLKNIEMYHSECIRWHQSRLKRTREILDAHDLFYVGRVV